MEKALISTLKRLGLTEYEAKAYLMLLKHGEADALKVSREAGVPRTRIYDVLSRLENRGLIQGIKGARPTIYTALPPNRTLKLIKDKLVGELEDGFKKLEELYLEGSPISRCSVWLLRGMQAYMAALELLDDAEESILVRMVYLPREILEAVWKRLSEAKRNGIKIYLIIDTRLLSRAINGEEILKLSEEFDAKRIDSLIPINGFVADFKSALLIYAPITVSRNPFGFLIQDLEEIGKFMKNHIDGWYLKA